MNEEYESFKEQVRSQADIVKVVSEYVDLKKKGNRYWGCCPFHGEKTPSFTVTPEKNLFHCFGCHAGGDVFNFVMKIENVTFPEAIKSLANKYGIPIPESHKTEREILKERTSKQIFELNALAVKFFQACLLKTKYGTNAIEYLKARGITSEIIERFSLGLAPPAYDRLNKALIEKKISEELQVAAGLIVKRQDGRVYDRFRDRIIIPIKDARGHVVGFTGRIINKGEPKYLNTGETDWFIKRKILFGMDVAFKNARVKNQIIVVEGHMDAISLHANGIDWTVATMGTAFTEQQARLIGRVVPEVVFCFDSDEAGLNAAMLAVPIAFKAGLSVKVINVPNGKDPDEFIRKEGKDAFLKLVAEAMSGMDYQIKHTLSQNDFSTLEGKVKTVSNILPLLIDCKSDIEIGKRIRELAQTLTVDENLIISEFQKVRKKGTSNVANRLIRTSFVVASSALEQAERLLLHCMVNKAGTLNLLETLEEYDFSNEERQEIYEKCRMLLNENVNNISSELFATLKEQAAAELEVILQLEIDEENLKQLVQDCVKQLKKAALERKYEYHSRLAAELEQSGDEKFLQELTESQRIKNEIRK
ncbi:MAG TPA: DNA primase, partial [Candidatus Avacidaminococcus intestinavium]|nr:DNA primase [Candidatus Avacidaminococcus intestinavium]